MQQLKRDKISWRGKSESKNSVSVRGSQQKKLLKMKSKQEENEQQQLIKKEIK